MAEAIITPVLDQMAAEPGPITADMGMIVARAARAARAARRFGAKTALVADGRTLTYQELDDLCDRVAGGLHDIGVRPGDRVSLYSPNRWEWVVAPAARLRQRGNERHLHGRRHAGDDGALRSRRGPGRDPAHRATVFDGVPTMYAMMLADPSLKTLDR